MGELQLQFDWYQELVNDIRKLEFTGVVVTKWHIGQRILRDELKFNKPEYGSRRIENLAKDTHLSKSDLYYCIQFARRYPEELSTAVENLPWRDVRKLLPESRREPAPPLALPEGKYNIIYADPPWKYFEGGYKNQSQHYDTVTIDEISALQIEDLAADDCLLFLWVTGPILEASFKILTSWGFVYSTIAFVWVKSLKDGTGFFFGNGAWTRANVELCLLGRRGSVPRQNASISQIIYEPIQEHSRKPDSVRDKIVQLVGDLPRIELFARQKVEGWDAWGNDPNIRTELEL